MLMKSELRKKSFYTLIFLTGASLFLPLYKPLIVVSAVIQTFFLPGLVFFFFFGDRNRPWTDNIFFVPLISPVVLTLTILPLMWLTNDLGVSSTISAGLFYLLFALAIVMKKDDFGNMNSEIPRNIIFLSFGCASLLILVYLLNDYLLIRSDAWYHASVINEIATRGIPPMEPYLPSKSIRYMWIYHLFMGAWKNLSGLPVFSALSSLNILSIFVLPYLAARIICRFISDSRKVFIASLLTVAGLESVSWVAWPIALLRTVLGDVTGSRELARIMDKIVFVGSDTLAFFNPYGTWNINISDKLITITAFSYSFELFILCFIIFLSGDYLKKSKPSAAVTLFTITIGTFLFHVITGTALIITLIGAGVLFPFLNRRLTGEKLSPFPGLFAVVIAIIAAGAGAPYFLSLGAAESSGGNFISEHLHFGIRSLFTILLPLLILFVPTWRAVRKAISAHSYKYAVLVSWVISLTILCVLANLPFRNEHKLIFPLFLMISPMINIEIAGILRGSSGGRKIFITILIFILFFVPPIMIFRGFLLARPPADHAVSSRYDAYKSEKGIFEWTRENTGEYAIIAEKGVNHLMPVFGARRNLAAHDKFWRMYGYDREYISHYMKINDSLFNNRPLNTETIKSLRDIEFDLYIAVFDRDVAECPLLATKFNHPSGLFTEAYSGKTGKLYHLENLNE